jgi:hypothetical protein
MAIVLCKSLDDTQQRQGATPVHNFPLRTDHAGDDLDGSDPCFRPVAAGEPGRWLRLGTAGDPRQKCGEPEAVWPARPIDGPAQLGDAHRSVGRSGQAPGQADVDVQPEVLRRLAGLDDCAHARENLGSLRRR